MRVLQGRGDWRPGFRIESLRRYAFIGDSYAYGFGVAPDQTLPAIAERQMNELLPAWPVEAVNLGVGGYNLWNSWLGFKYGPQVYDGVVLVLCTNDADLFERSYRVKYTLPRHTRWESTHPYGAAVARCFDDIASFSQESPLPVAVVYYNDGDHRDVLRIAEIINDLCALRGILYIDTFAICRDRHFERDDLRVSSTDAHPSAKVHEAVGRHLAATLKRQGWLGESNASEIGAAPDRILASAQAMVETNRYPPEAALNWAVGALDAKSRVARRLQASGAEDNFYAAAARASEALGTASRRWHTINRTRALVQGITIGGYGIAWNLFCMQEEKLKLEELCFALGTSNWNQLTASFLKAEPTQPIAEAWPSDAASFLEGSALDLLQFHEALDGLRILASPAVVGSPQDEALMLADLVTLGRIADRTQAECAELKASFLRLESIFRDARSALPEAQISYISSLIGAALKNMKESFGFVQRLLAAIKHIRDADRPSFTTIEISVSVKATEESPACMLTGQVNYGVPNRLPLRNSAFLRGGSTSLVTIHFPVFYAGRLSLIVFNPKATIPPQALEATLVKVELYNGKNRRLSVDPASFYKDPQGRLVSPLVHLL